jgi:hypothetical protein
VPGKRLGANRQRAFVEVGQEGLAGGGEPEQGGDQQCAAGGGDGLPALQRGIEQAAVSVAQPDHEARIAVLFDFLRLPEE